MYELINKNNSYCQSKYKWKIGNWDLCKKPCGYKKRKIECIDKNGRTVSKELCPRPVPKSKLKCSTDKCIKGIWAISPWTPCNRTCDTGKLKNQ